MARPRAIFFAETGMEKLGLEVLAAGFGLGLVWLFLARLRSGRARHGLRGAYFSACAQLFQRPVTAATPGGFPRLNGGYLGQRFDLQAVPDTLTFRKLPALWVLVTLPVPLPLRATLDVMVRPTGVEPFSNFHTLDEQIPPPPGFPEDCALRSDHPLALPPHDLWAPHLGLFDNPHVKELVLSPKGMRITFLAEEANRGRYLIFRDAELGAVPLRPETLLPYLDALLALQQDILAQETAPERRTA